MIPPATGNSPPRSPADLSIGLLSREHGLSSENADLVLRPEAITSLVACQTIAWEAAQRHRRNLALVLAPHISVVLLHLLLPVNPALAVLAVDLPVLQTGAAGGTGRIGGGQDAVIKPAARPTKSPAAAGLESIQEGAGLSPRSTHHRRSSPVEPR